jgi:4-carboxymuconolactone decarboxylase
MTRLPEPRRDDLDADGRAVWDALVASRGAQAVTAQGSLHGPFNAYVQAPAAGRALAELGATLRWGTTLERRLTEVAILAVAARWRAEFEWHAHAALAREQGVPDDVIEAIRQGAPPPFGQPDEQVVFTVARELTSTGTLGQQTYQAGQDLLGDQGMVELVALCGYYTLVSFVLNGFEVAVPEGTRPAFGAGPAGA